MYTPTYEETHENQIDTSMPPVFSMPLHKKQSQPSAIFLQSDTEPMVSETEYWEKYYHDELIRYEWNNGRLEEKDMPTHISIICVDFLLDCIRQYLKYNPIATLITYEHAFSINIQNTKRIRRPDYAVILKTNPTQMAPDDYSYKGTYDMCIELLSDTKKEYITKDTVFRKNEYANANVSEYFILDINNRKHTAFYRLDQKGNYVDIKPQNGVIKSTVLPGFQFRIQDIYHHPDLSELIDDDVYQHYILRDFQDEKREKEKAIREKEKAVRDMEKALRDREKALREIEKERIEKENALIEIKRLKQLQSGGLVNAL